MTRDDLLGLIWRLTLPLSIFGPVGSAIQLTVYALIVWGMVT